MANFGHFEPKRINVVILTKIHWYPIPEVIISNLTFVFQNFEHKCPNLGISHVTKFCMYHISNVLISNLTYAFCGS